MPRCVSLNSPWTFSLGKVRDSHTQSTDSFCERILQTLLYMLLQNSGDEGGTVPPSGFIPPAWDVLARQKDWSADLPPATTVTVGPTTVSLGHDDVEADDEGRVAGLVEGNEEYEFGWDNESPKREAKIERKVKVETRPVLNGEFYAFWKKGEKGLPPSWVFDASGDVLVRIFSSWGYHCLWTRWTSQS